MRNVSPITKMRKSPELLGTSCGVKFEKQNKHGETQSQNFRAYHSFVNSCRCIIAAKWDTDDIENTADMAK